ncbi:MAG: dephospho-CoA kinase [Methylophagaceae bacterium]
MLKIGLTGGIASGKSTVCALFKRYEVPIIDADTIARQLVESNEDAYAEIIQNFGQSILQKNKAINRKKLRQIIFSDPTAKQVLENILHPKIRQQLILKSQQQYSSYVILDIPLLIESKMVDLVDRVLVIDINPDLQRSRLQQRDDISSGQAQIMINTQSSQDQRLAQADDIIDNNNDASTLSKQVELLHKKYIKLSNGCQRINSHGQ